ncbi:ABC transporter permease [Nocardioides sp. zg-536]|uniref:ABC transporter permease n=1 Tax=Nocardioides faecalis TaxID=2803858 RepID=A0A938Y491_9ACTN|nr:ABC transporter permease [Nocardioides faecalis]MBM9459723.1 ABC transporter permease [Nocardioides faecalis]MBS4753500.1 ABC transporter permease [Nocardioides faecalis]QVI58242.1 ABC transporter permease [Nocardioides faecalis]
MSLRSESLLLLADAHASLTAKPMRSVALMAGILLGVATVVSAVLLADTQQTKVDRAFDQQRADVVVITGEAVPARGFSAAAIRQVTALPVAGPAGELSIWQDHQQFRRAGGPREEVVAPLVVADPAGLRLAGAALSEGDPFRADATGEVWLGSSAAQRAGVTVGDVVVVQRHRFEVAGLLSAHGRYAYVDSSVLMSRPDATGVLGEGENVRLLIDVRPGSAAAVADFARAVLDPGQTMFLANATPPDSAELPKQVGEQLRTLGLGLGLVVGIVGLIGVANTLAMTVAHRVRELGLRSALGWSRRRLATLILTESAVAGVQASVVGAAVAVAGVGGWCLVQDLTLIIDPRWLLAAIGGGVAASVIGGILPALQAGSISPMAAMRS